MSSVNNDYLDTMLAAYLECAAWSSTDYDGYESLEVYTYSDEAEEQARRECADFIDLAGDLLAGINAAQAGHDFWLTREGHGAGFWDRGLGEIGEQLSSAARSFGRGDLYRGDDDLLYFS